MATVPTLYREIDALGGTGEGERHEGYTAALNDVLALLERRGFTEAADTSANSDGWILHDGNSCPVASYTPVEVRVRGDGEVRGPASAHVWSVGYDWWTHQYSPVWGHSRDIIAYRIVEAA